MIENWPWYVSGIALAAVPILHWLALGRNLAVSGRFSAIINRLRFGSMDDEVELSQDELLAAIREATIAALGAGAVQAPSTDAEPLKMPSRLSVPNHLLFLGCMVLGGALSALLAGAWNPQFSLSGDIFNRMFGGSPALTAGVLLGGGVLVGFGTRMAAGCTTGHGLCGVSRFQKGSLAATAAFFGAGVAVSMILRVVL